MVSGYVINLPHRTDRLAHFQSDAQKLGAEIVIEPFAAINGAALVLDDTFKSRIHPWNLTHMADRQLRGVMGCALSHLTLWERIAHLQEGMVLIFEDDARLIDPDSAHLICSVLQSAPPDADLIWLNDYDRLRWHRRSSRLQRRLLELLDRVMGSTHLSDAIKRLPTYLHLVGGRVNFRRWQPIAEKTTEAYLISPAFAQKLYDSISHNLGAIDEHMRGYVAQWGGNVYEIHPPLFTQANRADTDIQSGATT